jgi:uncharacterized protein YpmB
MKTFITILLSLFTIFIGVVAYSFWNQQNQVNKAFQDIETRLNNAKTQELNLQSDIRYLANPLNLEKEIREFFNYKKPGETRIIIVPNQSSTATSSALKKSSN